MQTNETTPKQQPIPRNFILKLTAVETVSLLSAVEGVISPGIAPALPGRVFSYVNIRIVNAPGQPQTSEVQLQLIDAPASTAQIPTPLPVAPVAAVKPAAPVTSSAPAAAATPTK